MPKRLHDTECWKKEWFRHLSVNSKILWLYVLDACDCAGIWEKDLEMASFLTAVPLIDQNIIDLEKQIKPIDNKRFIVLDFIDFQYGELTETSKMRKPVFTQLAKFGLKYPIDTVSGCQDTVKRKRKDKDKDNDSLIKEGESGGKEKYFTEELESYQKLISDKDWITEQEKYHPNLNILLSLEKAHTQFWGTEDGWEHTKKKKSKKKNWKRTYENALSQRVNQVWKSKEEIKNMPFEERASL